MCPFKGFNKKIRPKNSKKLAIKCRIFKFIFFKQNFQKTNWALFFYSWQFKECPEKKKEKKNFGRVIKVWAKHVEKSKISKFSKFFSPIGPKLIHPTKRVILNPNLQKKLEESLKFEIN